VVVLVIPKLELCSASNQLGVSEVVSIGDKPLARRRTGRKHQLSDEPDSHHSTLGYSVKEQSQELPEVVDARAFQTRRTNRFGKNQGENKHRATIRQHERVNGGGRARHLRVLPKSLRYPKLSLALNEPVEQLLPSFPRFLMKHIQPCSFTWDLDRWVDVDAECDDVMAQVVNAERQ
jgi:hypothetical protein